MAGRVKVAVGVAAGALALSSACALAQTGQGSPERPGVDVRRAVLATYVSLGQFGQGLIWSPQERGEAARIALVLVHPHVSSLGNPLCGGLAERGFIVLCADPPNTSRPYRFGGYDTQAQTIGAAIVRVRQEPGVRTIVLAGHGEGGALAAFYQNVANNGPAVCLGPEKIAPCDAERLSGLLPAAALMLVDPDLGQAFGALAGLDPAIASEAAPVRRVARLDIYDPRNGFDPGQNAGRYARAFRKAYFSAQADRGERLATEARRLLAAVVAREPGAFSDDMPMFVAGAFTTPIWQVDAGLLVRTKRPHKLLLADGAASLRVLESIALPTGNPRETTSYRASALFSARQFLAGHAIRTTPDYDVTADGVAGVLWESSTTSTIANMAGVDAPLLVVANTAHSGVSPAEMVLDAAASGDKELVGVEGATHAMTPCQTCSGGPSRRFGDTLARSLDYIAGWLRRRA